MMMNYSRKLGDTRPMMVRFQSQAFLQKNVFPPLICAQNEKKLGFWKNLVPVLVRVHVVYLSFCLAFREERSTHGWDGN